jgi:hypothetical protein
MARRRLEREGGDWKLQEKIGKKRRKLEIKGGYAKA